MRTVEALSAARDAILLEWTQHLRADLNAAANLSEHELLDNFPTLLDSILLSLEHGENDERAIELRSIMAHEHAMVRAKNPAFTISDVMEEYRAFQTILLRYVDSVACDLREMETITTAMFNAVTVSAALFANYQREKITGLVKELERERDHTKLFIAALTHDIRQPLSVARYSAEILARQSGNVESLVRVRTSIERIAEMVNNLLDVVSTGTGKLPLKVSGMRPTELISRLLDEHRARSGDRFIFEFDEDTQVQWDPRQVSPALNNLIENALKYGDEVAPITVRLAHRDDSVSISVHNCGEPIPANELPTLFDPFRRATAAVRSTARGWGLGLAVVKAVAESHGGSVSVESTKAAGRRFTLTVPRAPTL